MKRALMLVGLAVATASFAADERPAHLLVLDLYGAGEYSDCRGLSARLIEDYEAGEIKVPAADMAKVYLVAACLADIFRDAGYAEAVERDIDRALALDPNVDPSLAGTRAFVADRFTEQRAALFAAQGPAGRRFSIGLVLSAEGPGGIHWRNTPLVGLRLGVGIVPWLAIEAGASLPVQEPPVDEGELWIGAIYRPAFAPQSPDAGALGVVCRHPCGYLGPRDAPRGRGGVRIRFGGFPAGQCRAASHCWSRCARSRPA